MPNATEQSSEAKHARCKWGGGGECVFRTQEILVEAGRWVEIKEVRFTVLGLLTGDSSVPEVLRCSRAVRELLWQVRVCFSRLYGYR